ncbi:PREDICTED: histone H1-like isoform X1 [Populus euphratica]|uniref:Histone H1-like isoform X1 n=1 Tax=Populus euphratica TaxID=75702 RepID=A0AAJ6V0C5_POPEU|nr:PREDICTED: histone H1-like isoform X1 [Populus euphratica]
MSATTKAKKPKSPRAYPSFHVMISDAILTLKERTGSSQYAITKFLEEKHKKKLPANFRKLLLVQLKKLVASQKLVKVKYSFKLPSARPAPAKKPQAIKAKTAKKKITTTAKKKITTTAKPKLKKITTPAKPKPKPKANVAAKPNVKTPVKAKPAAKPKKAVAKPAKVARTKKVASPGKKAVAVKLKGVKRKAAKK